MTRTMRATPEEAELIKNYADVHGMSVSDALRNAIFSVIEEEIDIETGKIALLEYRRNPVSHSLEEIEKKYGIE